MKEHNIKISDFIFNFSSYIIFGLCGLIINLYLFFFATITAVGVFNQFYAIFIISGQFFSLSIPELIVRKIPILDNKKDIKEMFSISFLICLISAFISFILLFNSQSLILKYTSSFDVSNGIKYLALAVPLFIINKFFFSFLISLKKFKIHSMLNSLRSIMMIIFIYIFLNNNNYSQLAIMFVATEFIIIIINFLILNNFFSFNFTKAYWYLKNALFFCTKNMPYSFLCESFIRIDILVLAFFCDDFSIGIYTLAAIFAEGIYQLSVYIRNLINPYLSEMSKSGFYNKNFFIKYSISSFVLSLISSIVLLALFTFLSSLKIPYYFDNIDQILQILCILLIGICIYSIISPYEMFFSLSGFPSLQSGIIIFITLLNILLNIYFIREYNIFGAAIATSLSFITYGIINIIFSFKIIKVIIKNKKMIIA